MISERFAGFLLARTEDALVALVSVLPASERRHVAKIVWWDHADKLGALPRLKAIGAAFRMERPRRTTQARMIQALSQIGYPEKKAEKRVREMFGSYT